MRLTLRVLIAAAAALAPLAATTITFDEIVNSVPIDAYGNFGQRQLP